MPISPSLYWLTVRTVREAWRQPGAEIGNLLVPLLVYAVILGAFQSSAEAAFGIEDYVSFQVPVVLLQAVTGVAGASGIALVGDLQSGYFDKLVLTPISRSALLGGRVLGDGVRSAMFAALLLAVGMAAGAELATGVAGAVVLITMAGVFGCGYSGVGLTIALRTGSTQAAQIGLVLWIPLLFLAPAFAPQEVFAGWLRGIVAVNPVTYLLAGMGALMVDGWELRPILEACAVIVGLSLLSTSVAIWSLRKQLS